MIEEVNDKLNLTGPSKITNFQDFWVNVTDAYLSILASDQTPNVEMSQFFIDHLEDVGHLGCYETCKILMHNCFKDFRDDFGTKIGNHHFFTFVYLAIAEKMGLQTDILDTTSTVTVPKDRKYYYFSLHDTTLTSYLSGVGRMDVHVPKFASK